MAKSIYGQTSGTDRKGVTFVTQAKTTETTAAAAILSGVRVAALTLETAVSTSLAAATGTQSGSMAPAARTALSASFSSVTGTIA